MWILLNILLIVAGLGQRKNIETHSDDSIHSPHGQSVIIGGGPEDGGGGEPNIP